MYQFARTSCFVVIPIPPHSLHAVASSPPTEARGVRRPGAQLPDEHGGDASPRLDPQEHG